MLKRDVDIVFILVDEIKEKLIMQIEQNKAEIAIDNKITIEAKKRNSNSHYSIAMEILNNDEKEVYFNTHKSMSKERLKRLRLELSRALLEIEKNIEKL